ncbi:2-amino-4-hydroxy-6-hydroxymethyldihydropteridine diphosphokinase [Candidatus Neomarinimicrobiota bacterium]
MGEQTVLGLGSNKGDREAYLLRAVELLEGGKEVKLIASSAIYETPPLDVSSLQEHYLNQVVVVSTRLSPSKLLALCQEIEVSLRRPRDHTPGKPRTIDIDIILYGSQMYNSTELILPHPAYTKRKFVLLPLAEVLPDFCDPLTARLEECPDRSTIHRYGRIREASC